MKVLLLRSIVFEDDDECFVTKHLISEYEKKGAEVLVYNMPACDEVEHWAGFAICDYTNWADVMICLDFPTALIKHQHKRIILTKPLPTNQLLQKAINMAIKESTDIYRLDYINFDCPVISENIDEYINYEVELCI